jgi:hypothetical protein
MARTIAGEAPKKPSASNRFLNAFSWVLCIAAFLGLLLYVAPDVLVGYGFVSPETMKAWLHLEKSSVAAPPATNTASGVGTQPQGAAPANAPVIQYKAQPQAPAAEQPAPPPPAPAPKSMDEGNKQAAPGGVESAPDQKEAEEGAAPPPPVAQPQDAPVHVEPPSGGKASSSGGLGGGVGGGAKP